MVEIREIVVERRDKMTDKEIIKIITPEESAVFLTKEIIALLRKEIIVLQEEVKIETTRIHRKQETIVIRKEGITNLNEEMNKVHRG